MIVPAYSLRCDGKGSRSGSLTAACDNLRAQASHPPATVIDDNIARQLQVAQGT